MLYEFECTCGNITEEFISLKDYKTTEIECCICGKQMKRVFTPFALHGPKIKVPDGTVELGNDYPKISQRDHMDGIEKTIHEVLDSGVDLDGSGDHVLNKLRS